MIDYNTTENIKQAGKTAWLAERSEISHNAKIKLFPRAGVAKVTHCDQPMFLDPGWENHWKRKRPKIEAEGGEWDSLWEGDTEEGEASFSLEEKARELGIRVEDMRKERDTKMDWARRARQRVFEYAMLNDFTWFITWTLDAREIDRYSPEEVSKKLKTFLSNRVQRNDARYIVLPEYHRDGAIHMHGFLSGNFEMIDSGRKDKAGRTIYNMPEWNFGWSTAMEVFGDYQKACYYLTKYVSKGSDGINGKQIEKIFGNYYYAGGHGLIRAPKTLLFDSLYDEIEAKEYTVDAVQRSFKYESLPYKPDESGIGVK